MAKQKWAWWVANPPYVPSYEKSNTAPWVLNYEPEKAIFVSEGDPLIFYKALIQKANTHLEKNGLICFEIYELFSKEVTYLLEEALFVDILVHHDMHGKKRWITARFIS